MEISPRICVLGCHNFRKEVAAAVAAEGWTDVTPVEFPSRCGRPPLSRDELRALLPDDCGAVLVLGRACLGGLDEKPADFPTLRLARQSQCFHLVAGAEQVDDAIAAGGYLLTPSWLVDWRSRIAEMGFPPDGASEFFGDFASRLVFLDTGVEPDSGPLLEELSAAVGLPATRLGVGIGHLRLLLGREVAQLRLELERVRRLRDEQAHRRELADHVSAMDLLARLAGSRDEGAAQAAIEDVFRMLFAPATLVYLRVEAGLPSTLDMATAEVRDAVQSLGGPWAWTPSGNGFVLRIAHDENTLGVILVDGLAFPEFRERYLNLALAISGVCALAIDNARTHKRLVEAEKMASLGILVAGVAHEINTPLGVGLAAISALQEKSAGIGQRFAERSMTQSDLQGYLDDARQGAVLVRGNLERIARLVDAFRQLALGGGNLPVSRFMLRETLADVITGMSERLQDAHATVELNCTTGLEIEGNPADWATILQNLLGNSLQHGFRGRKGGRVRIDVEPAGGVLRIDYADDGNGMTADVLRRVFDPFFTTDMQAGMGLGMHLAYNLVTQRLRGTIVCSSEPGQGCHFHIEVPR